MKSTIRLLFAITLIIAGLCSCEQFIKEDPNSGAAEFSVSMPSGGTKSASATDSSGLAFQIMISVQDQAGNAVLTDKVIPLYTFGTEFVSENVKIKAGQYKLIKFMVINSAGKVLYAAPVAGSPMAYLSAKPLPCLFNIIASQVTKIAPEVLPVGNATPDQFGYAAFGVQIVNPLSFWAVCVIENFTSASPIQLTAANLMVSNSTGWRFNYRLQAAVNKIIIRGGSDVYQFIVEKEGYPPQKLQFTAKDLLETTQEKPLMLKIPSESVYKVLVLQPGPDKGKDAMISNLEPAKNFGSHKYFEATFLSEQVLTVMRSNRSLLAFNLDTLPESAVIKRAVMTLMYDLPIPYDASIFKPEVYPSTGLAWYGGVFQQVIEPWEEHEVTWNLQPKTTEINQIFVAPFIRNTNMIEYDITRFFIPVIASGTASQLPNYGIMFKLWPADKFPGFRFGSSDFPEPKMRPKLTIYYTI